MRNRWMLSSILSKSNFCGMTRAVWTTGQQDLGVMK